MRRLVITSVGTIALLIGSAAFQPATARDGTRSAAACSAQPSPAGDWPATGGDLRGTRYQANEHTIDAARAQSLAPVWATKVGADGGAVSGAVNATPTESDGCVFIGTAAGDIVALDAATGALRWARQYPVTNAGLGGAIVGSPVVDDGVVYALVDETSDGVIGPYAVALDEHTGAQLWRSAPLDTQPGAYTNASPAVLPTKGGPVMFAGWSPAEGDSTGQGGFVLLDPHTGALLKKTHTIPAADQAKGYAGGGIWAPPAFDATSGYGFVGASNPYSKTLEHDRTNAILKIDLRSRSSRTFGEIVGSYKGVVDQYVNELHALNQSPACAASDNAPLTYPLDDPICGQLDLDFGAPVNVFRLGDKLVVGGLQKAGIYHLVDAATMTGIWSTKVGGPCEACNAAATAVGPEGIGGVSSPGGTAFLLDAATGAIKWAAPIADGSHYEGVTLANGVFYVTDNVGSLDAFDAATGVPLAHHPMAAETQPGVTALTSAGISVARNTLYVAASTGNPTAESGWVIAYH